MREAGHGLLAGALVLDWKAVFLVLGGKGTSFCFPSDSSTILDDPPPL